LTAQNKILSFKYPLCRLWESAARGGSTIRHTLATPLVIERRSGLLLTEKEYQNVLVDFLFSLVYLNILVL